MSQVKSEATAGDAGERSFLGQPRVLANLFGVELWERFSFYGMQGILAIYLYYSAAEGGLGISEPVALGIVGAYGGAVYLSTIIAAWIADRLLGAERTLFASAWLVVFGHLGLALIPGIAGVGVGLVLIALGSGGVKANASSLVGTLYAADDERRDAGFSLFYLGINLGALVGPLLTGLLQKQWGFHVGFGLAAIGMILGLVQYALGRSALPDESRVVPNPLPAAERGRWIAIAVAAVAAIVVLCLTGVITAPRLANIVIGISAVAAVALFAVILLSSQVTAIERSRVWAMVPLFVASAVFWSLYQQQFTVMVVYSDQRLDRDILGWEMPVSWVNSINPVFIILLSGVFAALWTKLGSRQPSTPVKFAIGTILMGIAFWVFLLMPSGEHTVPLIGLAFILLLFTLAELLLSPVGLSLATKLAPERFRTQMMALFFLSVALGTAMSGRLAEFYDVSDDSGFFWWVGLASVVVGVLLLIGNRPIRRLMAGVH
ncbi:proton-dependent oligopeptide transporter, POT family [Nocardioides sp. YR527]|uniref:peptide MFS transporter n=1 Tax=Nocardioides sp. YR527 TaxID=1881028 RepID=UPI000881B09B|nr:oligopeptide:H+ symporter [Nocardioides sp. YR527]SDL17691.1 proton-dependent oligopeptide transporter, POT family [Nocardioides sp. YR527]